MSNQCGDQPVLAITSQPTDEQLVFAAEMLRNEAEHELVEGKLNGHDQQHYRCQMKIADYFLCNYGKEPPNMPVAGLNPPSEVSPCDGQFRPQVTNNLATPPWSPEGPSRVKPTPSYAPVYAAALYPEMVLIAREHGYALAIHGSLQRDFDLIAVPWIDGPVSSPQVLVDAICDRFHPAKQIGEGNTIKPHGRRGWTVSIGHGDCACDISFMPTNISPEEVDLDQSVGAAEEYLSYP